MSIEIKPGRYEIDPVHSSISFSTRFVAARVRGTFAAFSGTVEVAEDLVKSSVTATIDVASVHTGIEARDEHLRSGDYFDVAGHPEATFTSTGLEADGDRYTLRGDLSIRGTIRPVELDLYFTGDGVDHFGNFRIGFRATTRVSRSAFGVVGNVSQPGGPLLIGDATELTLEIQATTPAGGES
ncbi:YceI family protein [Saccharopolyspora sp. K220]|uniref:YceI family protein n=1 Tax=Saccharopolyspora soli TaxID=2926618 RepID=UPI001F5A3465|nr:YceI family protein [Saccharopolyspora soli]MCI2423379.1 YceI family protein [Saccharopolyspora soli]